MKLTVYQLLLAAFFSSLALARPVDAQQLMEQRVSMRMDNQAIKTVLNQLGRVANVRFSYSSAIVPTEQRVSLNVTNQRLDEVLEYLLKPFQLTYYAKGRQVVLSRLETGLVNPDETTTLTERDRTVAGVVADETGGGLPGVSVLIKNTTKGTTTDGNGRYNLNVPEEAGTLVFSYVGYESKEVELGNRTAINVTLNPDNKSLNEVVVVGYGTQKRSSITGAVASVPMKEVADLPVTNIGQILQGKVAGVTVINNGAPGAIPLVRIRGISSINAGSGPLYVIDGFPSGDLNSWDPNNIESIEVLKDASAAAIYGSRAAAGVILITTKRGKAGKLKVTYDTYVGTQSPWRKLDLLNTEQYVQYGTTLLTNAGAALPGRFSTLDTPLYTGTDQTYRQTNTDWQSAILRSASTQSHHLSVSGGNETSRFYAAAGYLKQNGVLVGTTYDRKTAILNSEHKISKVFTFGQTLQAAYDYRKGEVNQTSRTLLTHAIRFQPYLPVEDPTRLGGYRGPDNVDSSDPENPVRLGIQELNEARRLKLLATGYLEARLTDWLRLRGTAGVDYSNLENTTFSPIYNSGTYFSRTQAAYSDRPGLFFQNLLSGQLAVDKTFGPHTVNAVAVAEQQTSRTHNGTGSGNKTTNDFMSGSDLLVPQYSTALSETNLLSFVGRVNYSYADKYLLSLSFRRDGSSQYGAGNKWGNFPAASIGWNLHEEAFLKNVPSISELRLRASYGRVGKNLGGAYPTQSTLASNNYYVFNNGTVQATNYTLNTLVNRQLQWENTDITNIGLDLGLFQNKLSVVAEYFDRSNKNLIVSPPLAPSLGYDNSGQVNIGAMRNWGYELAVSYSERSKPFHWNVSANASVINNQVQSLGAPGAILSSGSWSEGGNVSRTEAGKPVGYFYGYVTDGIFQSKAEVDAANALDGNDKTPYQTTLTAAGDIRFKDLDGNGIVDAKDQTDLGSYLPKFTYGVTYGADYKGFDLNVFFQGSQGNKIYSAIGHELIGMKRLFNASTDVLNAWTPTNTNTTIPRAISGDPNNNTRISDRFIQDGSYLRLKSVSVGYSVPPALLKTVLNGTLSRARIYVSSYNLLTFTKYTLGYDPEVGSRSDSDLTTGIDYANYPQNRTFQVGLQLGF